VRSFGSLTITSIAGDGCCYSAGADSLQAASGCVVFDVETAPPLWFVVTAVLYDGFLYGWRLENESLPLPFVRVRSRFVLLRFEFVTGCGLWWMASWFVGFMRYWYVDGPFDGQLFWIDLDGFGAVWAWVECPAWIWAEGFVEVVVGSAVNGWCVSLWLLSFGSVICVPVMLNRENGFWTLVLIYDLWLWKLPMNGFWTLA
jgi:hypothetical protein